MNILLLQREGTDLYNILLSSETSRNILKFYRPDRIGAGVLITSASLGSTLSLISELRWYIRRYVDMVLFEISDDIYCSHPLAMDIYEREIKLHHPWEYRRLIGFGEGFSSVWMEPGSKIDDYKAFLEGTKAFWEVWCSEKEWVEQDGQANMVP
jgi:hypothetical protein